MDEKTIEQIKNSSFFLEFKSYINAEINKLNSVYGLSKFTDQGAGEEVKIREKTIMKLNEILFPFIDAPKKKFDRAAAIEKANAKAGLE